MSDCSILRIGPIESKNGNAAVLRDAIISHFHDGASTSSSSSPSLNTDNNPNNLLTISNRYFDANVSLLGLDELNNNDGGEEDGILLIFDASLSTSFDSLGQFHSTAMQNDQCGELIRLCIGATHGPSPLSDGSKKSEEEYSRRVLWCLDHGYEYVEVDLTPEGMSRGHDERDKDGFARVVEAVSTCMWTSHVMKKRGCGGGGRAVEVGSIMSLKKNVQTNKDSSGESESQSNAIEKEKEETGTTATSSPANDVEREKAAMASLMQGMNNTAQSAESHDNTPKEENTRQRNHQEEMSIHQIESIISEAKLIREASQSNSMSDEERRDRAGDTAMKLMGLLDQLGFDEDEDTENEGSSSDDEGVKVAVDDQQ
mmetsp:Transcript_20164/g.43805  ORF Transcript_20164/g.43805 Transcript_20164/m.43805 type:complete len:371 (-) Transcript_20164:24-1136(-)